ncbi:MAG: ABC transporter permease [Deltaproteobacteria bacterium]|nr:ABC transporter permease [Deltaproteobacteria bacterium]
MKDLLRRPWVGPLLALLGVYALFCALSPETFLGAPNLVTMARQTVVVAIVAVGMTLVIILGGIDLSVGSAVALTTVVIAWFLRAGAGPWSAAVLGIGAAALGGALTGLLVTRLRVTPFIITLGGMCVMRGLAKGIAGEQKIDADPRGLDALLASATGSWALLPPGVWIALLLALLAAGLLSRTRFGRHVFAVGSNEHTARLCGVEVARVRVLVYVLAGLLTGTGGVMEFSTLTVGDPTDSIGLELEVIAAVVIGGGSLAGGEGSILGSLVGAMLMTVIKTGSTHLGLPNWVQEIVTGAIIVGAVALDRVRRRGEAGAGS